MTTPAGLQDENLLQTNSNLNQNQMASSNLEGGLELESALDAGLDSEAQVEAGAEAQVDAEVEADSSLVAEATVGLDSEISEALEKAVSSEPMDPDLDDTEKIMERYEETDAKAELAQKAMTLDGDARGGIDKISASSFAHSKDEDNEHLKSIFERYLTGGKGQNGMPDGSKIIERWNAQLAAEEAIKDWNKLSEPALNKFMNDYMQKSWEKFDTYNRGHIDILEATPFIRDLMQSMAPAPKEEVNEYEIDPVEEERKHWEKLDPVVEQDKAQEEDNANPKKEIEVNKPADKPGKTVKKTSKKKKENEKPTAAPAEDPLSEKADDKEPKATKKKVEGKAEAGTAPAAAVPASAPAEEPAKTKTDVTEAPSAASGK